MARDTQLSKPSRFISIHNHTNYSINDAMGTPFDHMDAVRENGMDAFVSSDHGTMAAFAPAYLYMKELRAKGVDFKYIGGCEMYIHPDLNEWEKLREKIKEEKKDEKKKKKSKSDMSDVEMDGLVIEDESSSKGRLLNPLNRRHHLVVLPKNSVGLENIFTLVSRSFQEGYYRFPRIDYKMLKEHGEGLLLSTACVAGTISYEIFDMFPEVEWQNLSPDLLDDPAKMNEAIRRIGNIIDRLVDAVGEENVFAELQFNKLGAQHLTNRAIIEFVRRTNFNVVATCDSHYPSRDNWRAREIYKALGWMNHKEINPDLIPKSRDDLKCELYPKNVDQMWSSYKEYCTHDFYDDEIVCRSIENGWTIAHEMIEDIKFDESPKLPKWIVPKGKDSLRTLLEICKTGMEEKDLMSDDVYVDRLKKEISVVHSKGFENYFLLMNSFMNVARKTQIIGPGRGCFVPGTRVKVPLGIFHDISYIKEGDEVIDGLGNVGVVKEKFKYEVDEELIELKFENGRTVTCTKDHEFLTFDGWVPAIDLDEETDFVPIETKYASKIVKKSLVKYKGFVYDLSVEDSHTYNVEGLSVHNSSAGSLINYLLHITQIDPIKHGLIFERFISKARCLDENLFVMTNNGIKKLKYVTVDDKVATDNGFFDVTQKIVNNDGNKRIKLTIDGKTYITSLTHRWIVLRDNLEIEVFSSDIRQGDKILMKKTGKLYDDCRKNM